MLGLAASHLSLYNGNDTQSALNHRVKAIAALNESLNHPCGSSAEGDARFGAIMALTFQASCMPEGMSEFLSMIRGCHIIAETGMLDFSKSLFHEFTEEGYTDSVRRLIGSEGFAPEGQKARLFEEFFLSLRKLAPLCTSPLEIKFLASAERVSKQVAFSAITAFTECSGVYNMFTSSSNEEFAPFLDPTSYPTQLLLIHFFFIEFAIGELCLGSMGERFGFRRRATLSWLNTLLLTLPDEYSSHAEWPLKYARVLAAGLVPRAPARFILFLKAGSRETVHGVSVSSVGECGCCHGWDATR
ncbi:hypothetical protein B0T16DRAFT_430984 [Cercophora newfieldiana]|uniref:Uncharacterized protein n=1 Tax=Cercophora newfieldiana TaxID=92897 RepID=A0AA39XVJ6_9PEZI|nr:hypothetical protein B0T16DRAFT_430984 [Cercophora newfieldiana]